MMKVSFMQKVNAKCQFLEKMDPRKIKKPQ